MSPSSPKRKPLWVWRRFAATLLTIGCIGWFGTFLIAITSIPIPRSVELPLGGLESIAVDSKGRIHCALTAYSRVQTYDAHGNFLYGWAAKSRGGGLRIKLAEGGKLELYVTRGHLRRVLDTEGNLLEEEAVEPELFYQIRDRITKDSLSPDGVHCGIALSYLFPRVVKWAADGHSTTVIRCPWYLWPLMAPLPAWIFCLSGIFGLAACDRASRSRRRTAKQ